MCSRQEGLGCTASARQGKSAPQMIPENPAQKGFYPGEAWKRRTTTGQAAKCDVKPLKLVLPQVNQESAYVGHFRPNVGANTSLDLVGQLTSEHDPSTH